MATQNPIFELFLTESEELLAELEQGLIGLGDANRDPDRIHRVFRAAHTLKGNAGMVGLGPVVAMAHALEELLDRVRAGAIAINEELVSASLAGLDALRSLIGSIAGGHSAELNGSHRQVILNLAKFLAGSAAAQEGELPAAAAGSRQNHRLPDAHRVYLVGLHLREDIFETGQDPAMLVLDLREAGEILGVDADITNVPPLDRLDPARCYLRWNVTVRTSGDLSSIEDVLLFVKEENPITIKDVTAEHHGGIDLSAADMKLGELLVAEGKVRERDVVELLDQQKKLGELLVESGKVEREVLERTLERQQIARRARRNSTVRVDTDKLDRLINLAGELSLAYALVNQIARRDQATREERVAAAEGLDQICRALQEQVLAVRMVPVEETFNRFKRVVRDLGAELGKHLVLETVGAETEIDKNAIEQLADPLKHMVRNAVGHGLESPGERLAAGKSDTGRVTLAAYHREGYVVLEVSDDGRGVDTEAVLAKAQRQGLVHSGTGLTEPQIYDLLFLPGFSTAQTVSEVSGRGVGMDVVKRNVAELRGTIEVESKLGAGTTFRIKIPLTMAILEGMSVESGNTTMTIPLSSVVELLDVTKGTLRTIEGKELVVDVRGEVLPVVELAGVLGIVGGADCEDERRIVILQNSGRKFGVLVDRVAGLEQAVVKSLDRTFGLIGRLETEWIKPAAISGATILVDGSVGLILDVLGIEKMAFDKGQLTTSLA